MSSDQLKQAIEAARNGRREQARDLLLRVVETDARNERAWLWLSGVVDDPSDVQVCLENVLALNPANTRARQGLEWLHARLGTPPPLLPLTSGAAALEREVDPAALSPARLRARAASPAPVVAPPGATPVEPAPVASIYTRVAPSVSTTPAVAPAPAAAPRVGAAASVRAAPAVGPAQVEPAEAVATAENLCPYCGAPTVVTQRRCTQCGNSLLVRAALSEQPSPSLGALTLVWNIGAALVAILALVFPLLGLLLYQQARFSGDPSGAIQPGVAYPIGMLIPATLLAVLTIVGVWVARALRQRRIWALYLALTLTVVGLLMAFLLVARADAAGAVLRSLSGELAVPAAWDVLAPPVVRSVGLAAILLHILAAGLVALSYGDFVGKLERFQHHLVPSDHLTHYNKGVALKDRAMWHAASLEWEWAVKKAPFDVTYLRALALAYAQLKRFDQARTMLDRALQIAPGQPKLVDDRRLIEQLAAEARR